MSEVDPNPTPEAYPDYDRDYDRSDGGTPRRRHEDRFPPPHDRKLDAEEGEPLSRTGTAIWKFAAIVAGIIVGFVTVSAWDQARAEAAAVKVVAPVEKKLDEHLAETRAAREMMTKAMQDTERFRRTVGRKLDALCRANAKADCPLGED